MTREIPMGARWRRLVLPLLVVLPVFVVLLGLGTWQLQRFAWKSDLLARIAAVEAAPAVPLPAAPEPFAKVFVTGRFDHAREALLGLEVRSSTLGARLLTPLLREGDEPILVDRGWVPMRRDGPIARPEGEQQVIGFILSGETAGIFAATDDVAGRHFYTFDPAAIGTALGLPRVAPFGLVVLGEGAGLPQPARLLPRPPNNHLGYVVTWYGVAAALVAVFAVWARRRLKENP